MQPFAYHRPRSVAEALSALRAAEEGKLLAGGQSLIPILKLDLAAPTDLVSLAGVEGLTGIRSEGGRLEIGAATTHAEVHASPQVNASLAALARLAGGIGDPQVRNRGTLGGSLAHADPGADYPAAVLGLESSIRTDRREIPGDAFFTGLFETALEPDEIVTAACFTPPERAAYAKFPDPASRYALAGVFVSRGAGGVRVAVTGAGPSVFRSEAMERALSADFRPEALAGVEVAPEPLRDDPDASAEYRAHLVHVMARRAVAECL